MNKNNRIHLMSIGKGVGTVMLCALLAMSLVWPTPSRAQSYSVAELQNLLNQILAQLNQLQGGSTSRVCPYIWTRSLGQGSTGADVMRLQQFLNSSPDTSLAVSGVGSSGLETQYYGPLTAAAVSKFQMKYRAQILTPLGLVNPTGYFGPSSMAQANRLCQSVGTIPDNDDDGELEGGAGSMEDVELMASIANEDVGEGENNVDVLGLEVEAEGSDIELTAVTVNLDPSAGSDDRFDRYAEEVSIWLDGEEYATVDADRFEDDDDHEYTISLDRGAIIREGDIGELIVAVSAVEDLGPSYVDDKWEVTIDSVRFRDAQDAVLTESSMDDLSRVMTFVEFADSSGLGFVIRGGDDEVNDSRVIEVSADDGTDNVAVLAFTVEAESGSDLTIDDLRVTATTTGATLDDVISAAYLYMDGARVGSESINSAADAIVFDNVDLDLEAGETYDFEVRVDLREANGVNYASGSTIDVDVTTTDRDAWVVEDERGDDVDDSDRRGSASADAHTLATEGAAVRLISTKTDEVYNSSNPSASYGEFRIVLEVEAIGDTIYVAETATRSDTPSSAHGLAYYFTNSSGSEYASGAGTESFSRISGGNMENGFVRISEGQTARFELVATLDPVDFGQYRAQAVSVGWNDSAASPDSYTLTVPMSNYRTSLQTISD